MPGPYTEHGIVIEVETGRPMECVRFRPDGLSGEHWLHQREEFDEHASREAVVDRYALPEAEEYAVDVVTVPAGEALQIGDHAATDDRTGGSDLVELLDRDAVPDAWIEETRPLAKFLK